MTHDVIVGANISHSLVLKPPNGFEDAYQGLSASEIPVAIPGTLDFQAGERGYDPQLMAGVAIPLQSRLLLWLPQPISVEGAPTSPYTYRILWRLRSQNDASEAQRVPSGVQKGLAGHLPQSRVGIPADNFANPNDPAQERVVLPVAQTSVTYQQTEPGGVFLDGVTNLRGQDLTVHGQSYAGIIATGEAPILVNNPALKAVASQGVYQNPGGGTGLLGGPTFLPFLTDAFGDEYIIVVSRLTGGPSWDFAGEDFGFSQLFGTANGTRPPVSSIGIFAMHGSGAT